MMRPAVRLLALSCLLTLLGACGRQEAHPNYDILAQAEEVPLVFTQALGIDGRLQRGLEFQTLDEADMLTLTAIDFRGEPFTHITFLAPHEINDVWDFARDLTGNEWSTEDEQSPWGTILTGATTVRDTLISSSPGLDLLLDMRDTLDLMGGPEALQDIVAVDFQVFVLRDHAGSLWSIDEQRKLTPEEIADLESVYEEIYQANNRPEVETAMKEIWEEILEQSDLQSQVFGYRLSDFEAEDGSLALGALLRAVETSGAYSELAPQDLEPEKRRCFLFICTSTQRGSIPSADQATQGGFAQYRSHYWPSAPYGAGFSTISCVINDNQYNKPLGCGPSAFIGLLGRKYRDGVTIDGRNIASTSLDDFRRWLIRPNGVNGRPAIANYMGTCWNGGGSMTTGSGFTAGARAFLRDAGTSLTLHSNVSHYLGNTTSAGTKARILVQEIGRENNPVVAEYFYGPSQGHFSAVSHFEITWGATVGVNIKTVDHNGRWYSLSGTWGTERGLFYLD